MTPDNSEAERFLAALDPTAARFTFQSVDDNAERNDKSLLRVLHGTLAQHWDTLAAFNERGAGIFVTINAADFKGRKAHNIVRVRALYLDLDGPQVPAEPAPHIVVESSAGHWHVYWRVAGVRLEEFADKQRALIALHGGDPAVCDLPRVMRLPGFFHRKATPRFVRVVRTSNRPDYAAADFPAAQSEPRKPNAELTADDARVARALAFIPNHDVEWKLWCDLGLALYGATGGRDVGFTLFDAWSRRSAKYDQHYTAKTWEGFRRSPPNRIGAGTIFHIANRYCPKWADWLDAQEPDALDQVAEFLEATACMA